MTYFWNKWMSLLIGLHVLQIWFKNTLTIIYITNGLRTILLIYLLIFSWQYDAQPILICQAESFFKLFLKNKESFCVRLSCYGMALFPIFPSIYFPISANAVCFNKEEYSWLCNHIYRVIQKECQKIWTYLHVWTFRKILIKLSNNRFEFSVLTL